MKAIATLMGILVRISKNGVHNFQALIERFTDIPNSLVFMLRQVSFL